MHVCAGISNCRIVLWEYHSKWNGQAAELYKGPILKTLKKQRDLKASYLLVEDNDPTGYINQARRWPKTSPEAQHRRVATLFPRPDAIGLHPLDGHQDTHGCRSTEGQGDSYSLQDAAEAQHTALTTPKATVRKALIAMRRRASMICQANGLDIARD